MIASKAASKRLGELVYGMPREKYDRLQRVNWSRLKFMLLSPAHYRHALTSQFEDTDAKALGRAVHVATLEPELFNTAYVMWDLGRRAGGDWERFKDAHDDCEILTEKAFTKCRAIQQAVRNDRHASKYLAGGKSEITALWKHVAPAVLAVPGFEIDCKGRIDFEAANALVDLKTTKDASDDGFGRESWRYSYHVQAAFYSDGYFAATGHRKPYVIVAVESHEPWVVQVYRVPEHHLQKGRETYQALLGRVDLCRAENDYPGYSTGELELSLPRWAAEDIGETDLDELDLEFHETGER